MDPSRSLDRDSGAARSTDSRRPSPRPAADHGSESRPPWFVVSDTGFFFQWLRACTVRVVDAGPRQAWLWSWVGSLTHEPQACTLRHRAGSARASGTRSISGWAPASAGRASGCHWPPAPARRRWRGAPRPRINKGV